MAEQTAAPADKPAPEMSAEEREIEQKMLKVITQMPETVRPRFKVLHMLSDERSKINDEFEREIKELEQKMLAKKKPLLEKRDLIVMGEVTAFDEYIPIFDET